MSRRPTARVLLPLAAAGAALVGAGAAAQGLVGEVARQVDVLAIFFGGVGAGAGLTAAIVALRARP